MSGSYHFQGYTMRPDIRASIDRYVQHGEPRGDFLSAVLANDLAEALARADDDNLKNLKAIVGYIHWETPSACHGSRERYAAWLAMHPACK